MEHEAWKETVDEVLRDMEDSFNFSFWPLAGRHFNCGVSSVLVIIRIDGHLERSRSVETDVESRVFI